MSIIDKDTVNMVKGMANFLLSIRREARASRAEERSIRRLEIAEERLELQEQKEAQKRKAHFGRLYK